MMAMKSLSAGTGIMIDRIEHSYPTKVVYRFIGMGDDTKEYKAMIYYRAEGPIFKTKLGTMRINDFEKVYRCSNP